jgi:hypothetical protein
MKTQEQAILDALLGGQVITGSNAYAITKKECNCGTLNLHKVLAKIRKKGYTINECWQQNQKTKAMYKEFTITNKKQKKNEN